jgi:hypothetical protein
MLHKQRDEREYRGSVLFEDVQHFGMRELIGSIGLQQAVYDLQKRKKCCGWKRGKIGLIKGLIGEVHFKNYKIKEMLRFNIFDLLCYRF